MLQRGQSGVGLIPDIGCLGTDLGDRGADVPGGPSTAA